MYRSHRWLWALFLLARLLFVDANVAPRSLQLEIAVSHQTSTSISRRLTKRDTILGLGTDFQVVVNSATIAVNVTLGTPPQPLQLLTTTLSADLVIISSSNSFCDPENACPLGTFDSNTSSTYTVTDLPFNISYADGTGALGIFANDTMRIGNTSIDGLQFGLAQDYLGTGLGENVLGLGYIDSQANDQSYANLPQRLYLDGATNVVGYSIWFDAHDRNTGKLALGSIDTGQFEGTLETLPIQPDKSSLSYVTATINMDSMFASMDGTITNFNDSSVAVLLDAGTTGLWLPSGLYSQVIQYLGATFVASAGVPVQNKTDFRNDSMLGFVFGATRIQIPVNDVAYAINDDYVYFVIFDAGEGDNILGMPFARNVYSVFDYSHNQISIAALSHSTESNLTLIDPNGVVGMMSTAPTNATQTGPSNSTSTSTDSTRTKSGTNVGAIAGGVVGGVVGLALIIGGVGYMLHRKKAHERRQSRLEISQVQ